MRSRKWLYAVLILVALAVLIGVPRWRGKRSSRFPNRVVRSLPVAPHRRTEADFAGDAPEPGHPVSAAGKIATLDDLHHWLLDAFRGKSSRQRLEAVFDLGKQLGEEDFDRAMKLAKQIPVEWMQSVLSAGICFARGRDHQGQAMKELEDGDYRDPFTVGGTWAGWATANPQAAVAAAKEENDRGIAGLVFAAWGFEDLDAMLTGTKTMPAGVTNFLEWAKADPERAVDYALTLDEGMRAAVLERIAHGWASNWSEAYRPDFMSYLSIALQHGDDKFLSRSLLLWWGQYDPAQAIAHAATSDSDEHDDHLSQVLYGWMQSDADAPIEWLKNYTSQHNDSQAAADFIRAVSEMGDPATGARVLDAFPALEDSRGRVLKDWMQLDPASAYDWVAGKQLNRDELLEFAQTAGYSMARWNLTDALDWVRQRNDAGLQARALSGVALVAAYSDDNSSTDWILALPTGADRDRCVTLYVAGALLHAKGEPHINEQLLHDPGNVIALAKAVQDSQLDDAGKQRLLGLIYGWMTK